MNFPALSSGSRVLAASCDGQVLESRFGLWVPKDSEERRLPAAGLSTHR
ncbi:UNVERIFIED_CONTAM: putative membrane protein [Streptomyces canus]